mmetsp:Transcript_27225/g.57025  ORF Transcript_27225/g.57025 Transcript_27225/m.57025 type:complete len:228 (-) Transcript_27225:1515-2198(-)
MATKNGANLPNVPCRLRPLQANRAMARNAPNHPNASPEVTTTAPNRPSDIVMVVVNERIQVRRERNPIVPSHPKRLRKSRKLPTKKKHQQHSLPNPLAREPNIRKNRKRMMRLPKHHHHYPKQPRVVVVEVVLKKLQNPKPSILEKKNLHWKVNSILHRNEIWSPNKTTTKWTPKRNCSILHRNEIWCPRRSQKKNHRQAWNESWWILPRCEIYKKIKRKKTTKQQN